MLEVDRRVDILCFEKGWENFIDGNNLKAGQILNFVHVGDYSFSVIVKH